MFPRRSHRSATTFAVATLAAAAVGVTPAVAAPGSDAPARAAAVVDCHVFAYYPNILISSARNISCRQASRDMRRYRGAIHRRFRTPGGFTCVRVSGMSLGGQWRCVAGARAYRFEFGD